jgi:hypothetical protein
LGEKRTDIFFRRRRFYLNQYYDKAIYFDRKTHEVLEAPKSKLLDTEKSSRMNRHIPLLVVLFIASGSGISSFFSLFLQGTYSMTAFWSVILIWIAEFAFITLLVERALYRNVNKAQVTTQTVCLTTMIYPNDENQDEEEKTEKKDLAKVLFYILMHSYLLLLQLVSTMSMILFPALKTCWGNRLEERFLRLYLQVFCWELLLLGSIKIISLES